MHPVYILYIIIYPVYTNLCFNIVGLFIMVYSYSVIVYSSNGIYKDVIWMSEKIRLFQEYSASG